MPNVELTIQELSAAIWDDRKMSDDEENELREYYNTVAEEHNLNILDFEAICRKAKYRICIEHIRSIPPLCVVEKDNKTHIMLRNTIIGEIEHSMNRYFIFIKIDDSFIHDPQYSQFIDNYEKDLFNARIDLDRIRDLNNIIDIFSHISDHSQQSSDETSESENRSNPKVSIDTSEEYRKLVMSVWEDNNLSSDEIMMIRVAPKELGIESQKAFGIYIQTLYTIIAEKISALSSSIKISKAYDKKEKIGVITFSFYDKKFFIIKVSVTQIEFMQKLPFTFSKDLLHSHAVKLKETGPFVWYKINGLVVKDLEKLINNTQSTLEFLGMH